MASEGKAPIALQGFLNILKPPGMTSHDVVGYVRHVLHTKKVGHAGTLDPGAAGVLPVAVGAATRLIEYLERADKSYRAIMRLGAATDSGDDTGALVESVTGDFAMPSRDDVERVLQDFTGDIVQTPSVYSAIKIDGKRACDLARAGKDVDMPMRHIHISELALIEWRAETRELVLDVTCSKGTYIRTLCVDIGRALRLPATMEFLLRRRVGAFELAAAATLEQLAAAGADCLLPVAPYLAHLPHYNLAPERERAFGNGLPSTEHTTQPEGPLAVFVDGRLLGIGRYDARHESIVPVKVIH